LPEEFDLFFDSYYNKHKSGERPKKISIADFEQLIEVNERILLE
jgi:hypothetical protein